ncbi:MAG TPA: PadR family transcriptional regulator [Thermomicrobiales bacterium]|nr:PadR family transcriptional regulator [Thermomicrobiales bacterium]
MSTSHVLLALLATSARHGYQLKRAYDERFPQARPLAFGQVYATLERLVRDGLIEPAGTEPGEGPERVRYVLTPAGRAALDAWLAEVEPPAPFINNALFAKVVVALLLGAPAEAYLHAQREAHMRRMRELTLLKSDASASVSDIISADYALAHLDADLRWMELTGQRLEELREEVLG